MHVSRRSAFVLLASSALAGGGRPLRAADKFVTIGINLPLTGAASEDATNILHGAQLAIEEANARGGVGGYEIRQLVLDDGTATAGQYRSRAVGDQRAQDDRRPHSGRRGRPAGER